MFVGDVYSATNLAHVPRSLEAAVERLRSSDVARTALGDAVVDHYIRAAEVEIDAARRTVADWERARYFERI